MVLDEVHQLPDPSRLLKIGADAFPKLKILATGSSTLAATQKFRDSLTGRKRVVELVPVLHEELPAFGMTDYLLRGGLPPALLAKEHNPEFYAEWLDSYFARDVQELFRLEKRDALDAIECKWNPEAFETRGLAAFREQYPKGKNYAVSPLNGPSYERVQGGLKISIVSLGELRQAMA